MKLIASILVLSFLLVACSATSDSAFPTRSVNSITIDKTPRSYILRLPNNYDGKTKLPMVMLIHGATDSAEYAEKAYHVDEKAAAAGFILVIPDAILENHVWNAFGLDTADSPNNDLAFLTTLLTDLPKTYAIDTHRIYVAGHSVGAMMTYRLAAEHPDLIAAAGIVAGSVGDPSIPAPKMPVPIIAFHGKKDTNVPYGDPITGTVDVATQFWIKANHLNRSAKIDFPVPTVRRDTYASADPAHADFVLYSLDNGNHMWPGGNLMPGKTEQPVQDISATDLIWDFFKAHTR